MEFKKFIKKTKRTHVSSAKQIRQGQKEGSWLGSGVLTNVASSLKPKNILKNPVYSGESLTGGILKAARTCSVCPTLWLLMFLGIASGARRAHLVCGHSMGPCVQFPGLSTWRQLGGTFLREDIFSCLSLVAWNCLCSSFPFNLTQ